MIIHEFMSFERVYVEAGLVAGDGVPACSTVSVTLTDRITEARYVVFTACGHDVVVTTSVTLSLLH